MSFHILKSRWVYLLLCVLVPYIYAMVANPLWVGGWARLHKVWFDWQTFNSAMVALLAALIGLLAIKQQNYAQFRAARALLPDALSLIHSYLEQLTYVLEEALQKLDSEKRNKQSLDLSKPEIDNEYKSVFSICIANGPSEVQKVLTEISIQLQITKSRTKSLYEKEFHPTSKHAVYEENTLSELVRVLKLQKKLEAVFPYARGELETVEAQNAENDLGLNFINLDGNTIAKLYRFLDKSNQ